MSLLVITVTASIPLTYTRGGCRIFEKGGGGNFMSYAKKGAKGDPVLKSLHHGAKRGSRPPASPPPWIRACVDVGSGDPIVYGVE